jgi:hypothetical protein
VKVFIKHIVKALQMSYRITLGDIGPGDFNFIVNLGYDLFKAPLMMESPDDFREIVEPWARDPSQGVVMAHHKDRPLGFLLYNEVKGDEKSFYKGSLNRVDSPASMKMRAHNLSWGGMIKSARRRGIFENMLKKAIRDFKKSGTEQVVSVCWKGERGQSYPLLTRKFTFSTIEEISGYYENGDEGIVVAMDL